MKRRFWLSYDLGLRGDYDSLYTWLDSHKARECGDSVATFQDERTREELSEELRALVYKEKIPARLYLIGPTADSRFVGGYITGKRKVPAWTGFATSVDEGTDDEA